MTKSRNGEGGTTTKRQNIHPSRTLNHPRRWAAPSRTKGSIPQNVQVDTSERPGLQTSDSRHMTVTHPSRARTMPTIHPVRTLRERLKEKPPQNRDARNDTVVTSAMHRSRRTGSREVRPKREENGFCVVLTTSSYQPSYSQLSNLPRERRSESEPIASARQTNTHRCRTSLSSMRPERGVERTASIYHRVKYGYTMCRYPDTP